MSELVHLKKLSAQTFSRLITAKSAATCWCGGSTFAVALCGDMQLS